MRQTNMRAQTRGVTASAEAKASANNKDLQVVSRSSALSNIPEPILSKPMTTWSIAEVAQVLEGQESLMAEWEALITKTDKLTREELREEDRTRLAYLRESLMSDIKLLSGLVLRG